MRSNKFLTFFFTIQKSQKESVETSMGVTPSITPISHTGWATTPPSSTIISLRGFICIFSEEAGIALVLPARTEPLQSLSCCFPKNHKHDWHRAPGIAVLGLFPFNETTWEENS